MLSGNIPNIVQLLQLSTNIQDKKLILEPICSLFRIILLQYKKDGTKISIYNNSLQYIEPSPCQGLLRSINGDKREDLHNIYSPIIKCMEWLNINDNEIYLYFYNSAINGLDKLLKAYDKDSIINHTLVHYKTIIQNYIEKKKTDKILNNTPLIENFKDLWKNCELLMIYNILLFINNSDDIELNKVYIKNIENLLDHKELIVKTYIESNSTTYN
jgi:hypothetical protein